MRTLVFGSLNIDRTYTVAHISRPGETISARNMALYCGGKGFNQAIALKRAGLDVSFAGAVGQDGQMLLDALDFNGIDRSCVEIFSGESTGHAVIQVDEKGQNSILILAGTNGSITEKRIREVLEGFSQGDLLVAQNEISHGDVLLREAKDRGLRIAFNPSPYTPDILSWDLSTVDYLLINETEGEGMTGRKDADTVLSDLHARYPAMRIVLTLGSMGSVYMGEDGRKARCGIYPVRTVDTTAAGDTFTGYFLSAIVRQHAVESALKMASVAAGLAVSRKGAEPSIPGMDEVESALNTFSD